MSVKKKLSVTVVIALAFITGVFFTTMGAQLFGLGGSAGWAAQSEAVSVDADVSALQEAFVEVAEAVNPAVVQIQAERIVEGPQRRFPGPFGEFFEDFFDRMPEGEGQRSRPALGSGVIIRANGYIITNNHVVENAQDLRVKLFNGAEYSAEIVGADQVSDLAIIKIDEEGLPHIGFGDADEIQVGQWVMAFGSPLSLELSNTVTAGIISALGRYSQGLAARTGTDRNLQNFIQTDAAINPGNSGGPLVSLQGELIGINNAIYSRTGGYQGIGFAIPVNVVQSVAQQLIETGEVQRARLGIEYTAVSEALARALELPRGAAQVAYVMPGSPADRAGLREGDIIVAIDGETLNNYQDLGQRILTQQPGTDATLTIVRDAQRAEVSVVLGALELEENETTASRSDEEPSLNQQGRYEEELGFEYMTLREIPPRWAYQRFEIESTNQDGVLIIDIDPQSYAFEVAAVRAGLLIVGMEGRPVSDISDFQRIYESLDEGETFLVTLRVPGQDGSRRTALVK